MTASIRRTASAVAAAAALAVATGTVSWATAYADRVEAQATESVHAATESVRAAQVEATGRLAAAEADANRVVADDRAERAAALADAKADAEWVESQGWTLDSDIASALTDPDATAADLAEVSMESQRIATQIAVRAAVEDRAGALGLIVSWETPAWFAAEGLPNSVGVFETTTPGVVTLSDALGSDVVTAADPADATRTAMQVLYHEAAHAFTLRTCGTLSPAVADDRVEHVTDSLANILYGVQTRVPSGPDDEYGVDPHRGDVAAAEAIIRGDCDATPSGVQ